MTTLDARVWLAWLFAGGLLAILIGNPLYLVFLLLISRLVEYACAPPGKARLRLPFGRISLMILVFSTLLNMLSSHLGETVVYTLPADWPLVGGPLTLEAAVFGFINGLRLITLLSFFLAFNAIVPTSQLAGLTPRALHELGLVMLIAITYVPETIRQFQRIRDAQAIRGHRTAGLGSWRPLLIPLLISGLERAMNLSETMVARGYGSTTYVEPPLRARLLLIAGMLLSFGGALWLAWSGEAGWAVVAAGLLLMALAYYSLSRLVPRTRYHSHLWTASDAAVLIGAIAALLAIAPFVPLDRASLVYAPYPAILPPPFSVAIAALLFGLVVPALLAPAAVAPVEAAT